MALTPMDEPSFTHVDLPHIGKRVLRLGIAGNYGMTTQDVHYASERGAGLWVWSPNFRTVTPALRQILERDREGNVVAVFAMAFTGGMARRTVEKALRILGVDQIDILLLGWLGRTSVLSGGVQKQAQKLMKEGKIRALGASIHDRVRAGKLAQDSILDVLMLRYNAKHPGAERDVFPHLHQRRPLVISYTATSWRQLLKPLRGVEMPPWPGPTKAEVPPLTPQLCYRFCLSSPHVHVVLTAPQNRDQLDDNLAALEAGPLGEAEDAWVREYGRKVKAKKRLPFL